jgi:hypothetical protein
METGKPKHKAPWIALRVVLGLALVSAVCHVPGDINAAGKAVKNHEREKTFKQAFNSVVATGTLMPLDVSGCSEANYRYDEALSNPSHGWLDPQVKEAADRFNQDCRPLIVSATNLSR